VDKRQLILEAATTSFSMFGYKATTMDQVAKIARVGKGTVYIYYENKQQLLEEAVVSMIEEMKKQTEQGFDASISFMENVHKAIINLMQYREKHILFVKLLEEEKRLQTPEVQQMLMNINQQTVSYISSKLEIAIQRGEIRQCNTKVVAYVMLKSYLALIFDWQQMNGEALPEDEIVNIIQETIIRGLTLKDMI